MPDRTGKCTRIPQAGRLRHRRGGSGAPASQENHGLAQQRLRVGQADPKLSAIRREVPLAPASSSTGRKRHDYDLCRPISLLAVRVCRAGSHEPGDRPAGSTDAGARKMRPSRFQQLQPLLHRLQSRGDPRPDRHRSLPSADRRLHRGGARCEPWHRSGNRGKAQEFGQGRQAGRGR